MMRPSTLALQTSTTSPTSSSRSLESGSRRVWLFLTAFWVDRTAAMAEEWKVLAVTAPLLRRSLRTWQRRIGSEDAGSGREGLCQCAEGRRKAHSAVSVLYTNTSFRFAEVSLTRQTRAVDLPLPGTPL